MSESLARNHVQASGNPPAEMDEWRGPGNPSWDADEGTINSTALNDWNLNEIKLQKEISDIDALTVQGYDLKAKQYTEKKAYHVLQVAFWLRMKQYRAERARWKRNRRQNDKKLNRMKFLYDRFWERGCLDYRRKLEGLRQKPLVFIFTDIFHDTDDTAAHAQAIGDWIEDKADVAGISINLEPQEDRAQATLWSWFHSGVDVSGLNVMWGSNGFDPPKEHARKDFEFRYLKDLSQTNPSGNLNWESFRQSLVNLTWDQHPLHLTWKEELTTRMVNQKEQAPVQTQFGWTTLRQAKHDERKIRIVSLASMFDIALLIKFDKELFADVVSEIHIQGGVLYNEEGVPVPDPGAMNNKFALKHAEVVYSFLQEHKSRITCVVQDKNMAYATASSWEEFQKCMTVAHHSPRAHAVQSYLDLASGQLRDYFWDTLDAETQCRKDLIPEWYINQRTFLTTLEFVDLVMKNDGFCDFLRPHTLLPKLLDEDRVEENGIIHEIANENLDATKREMKLKNARSKLTSRSLNYIINTLNYTQEYAKELSENYHLMNTIILETAYSTAVANWFSTFFIELLRKPFMCKENPLDNAYFKHEGFTIKLDVRKKLKEFAIDGEINKALENSNPFLSFLWDSYDTIFLLQHWCEALGHDKSNSGPYNKERFIEQVDSGIQVQMECLKTLQAQFQEHGLIEFQNKYMYHRDPNTIDRSARDFPEQWKIKLYEVLESKVSVVLYDPITYLGVTNDVNSDVGFCPYGKHLGSRTYTMELNSTTKEGTKKVMLDRLRRWSQIQNASGSKGRPVHGADLLK
ncbi:hypothetical protein B0J11DRAFT_509367 [Dendryphion nanum]|uniref:Uncharacterized protein n=1 Tax=Dendryphion nanum TaxID=256645 RepID=A0A9P9IDI2_9PLEO|nr:hypothetical protein B0J11DRAFT_509367 [Dendryphion nanum]